MITRLLKRSKKIGHKVLIKQTIWSRAFIFAILLVTFMTGCGGSKEIVLSNPITPTTASQTNVQPIESDETVKVGLLVITTAADTMEVWQPILDYLSQETGRQFEGVPVFNRDMFQTVERGEVDFVTSNPLSAVQMRRLYGIRFLVTNVNAIEGDKFGAALIVRRDSDIETLEDLRGKRGMSMKFRVAAGGYAYQTYLLKQNGIDPHADFSEFVEAQSQNDIVLSVANGTTDVGFIRTGQLEKMDQEGLINMEDFRVIHQIDDGHPYVHSTPLHPEWPVAALAHVDDELAQQVKEALLKLTKDHPAITTDRTVGFVEAGNYSSIDELIEALQLPSWDAR